MNFLTLCQTLVETTGISGSITSVSGQTGEMLRVVNWINRSWHQLQLKRTDWDWMRYDFTLQTVANQREYNKNQCTDVDSGLPVTSLSRWHRDTLRIYKTSAGRAAEMPLQDMQYLDFRDTYMLASEQVGPPDSFTVRPRGKLLMLGPLPDDIYTVTGQYQRAASYLSGDDDEPDMPEDIHMLIVEMAREKYAIWENAQEVLFEAQTEIERLTTALFESQTGEVTLGDPLA